jgi:glycerol-3-phosphate dehydrogenase (NAD(P)+)
MSFDRIAIAGAGAFGTALASVAGQAGRSVILWARGADPVLYHDADIVLLAVPAQATRALMMALAKDIPAGVPIVACAKGIEQGTGRLQSQIIREVLPGALPAALSGPGFAEEIAAGLPTAVTIAAEDIALAEKLCAALATDAFRPYASDDLVGVEMGGAIKNVLAIAAGIVAGRHLGESARAALIARGLAEMLRLGVALGARAETFMGLSGLGDLVLTATSKNSRNLAFGTALAGGRSLGELLAKGAPLVEGAHTARIAAELARRHGIDAPIIAAVAAILDGAISVDAAIDGLANRPLKREME